MKNIGYILINITCWGVSTACAGRLLYFAWFDLPMNERSATILALLMVTGWVGALMTAVHWEVEEWSKRK